MRIAIVGGGTVGGGVVELLAKHRSIELVYLIVRNVHQKRDFVIPPNTIVSDNWQIIKASKLDLVVELMGGTDIAWDLIQYSLGAGISVVSANKALISKQMLKIEALCKENECGFLFEAAVCGGIPIINTLLRGMRADEITDIKGVMNGSTNWMLDKMDKEKVAYDSLLREAKSLGYLEADPSADIQGWDARSKLSILMRIAFGVAVNEEAIVCRGIDTVGPEDMQFARSQGKTIKLLARAWMDGNKVHAFVAPALVDRSTALGNLPGAGNCVEFNAKYSGHNVLIGSGAGRYPTANSVVADILSNSFTGSFGSTVGLDQFEPDFVAKFTIRTGEARKEEIVSYSKLVELLRDFPTSSVLIVV